MDDKLAPNANAFASTFYFYLRKMQLHEKIKRACKPTHGTVQGFGANLTRQCFDREKSPAGNSTFAIGGVSCFADSLVVAESFVLLINICGEKPAHRKSAKRYQQG